MHTNLSSLKEWPKGSLEEVVQNAIKTWEMELSHKTNIHDFKTINPQKFKLFVNGSLIYLNSSVLCSSLYIYIYICLELCQWFPSLLKLLCFVFFLYVCVWIGRKGLSGEETLELGSYNALLKTSMPEKLQYYKTEKETFESSHEVFRTAFPRGFAWEVLSVYSGPPVIVFKFRHWGYMEGPFKGHAPTGELVEFSGVAILKVALIYPYITFYVLFPFFPSAILLSQEWLRKWLLILIDGILILVYVCMINAGR